MEKWVRGDDLLKRWGILCFELRELCRSGALTPTCDQTGFEITPINFPCIFCDHEGEGCPHYERDDCTFANVPGFKIQHAVKTLRESWFKGSEVLACEKVHGLGHGCNNDDGPDTRAPSAKEQINAEKQDIEDRVKEKALIIAGQQIAQGRRMTQKELRIKLLESGFRSADITDRMLGRIWKAMPSDSKSQSGRPKNSV